MTKLIDVKVPDIGDATDVDVIEILVSVGDEIKKGASLIALESDKASMEVPSSHGGTVKSIEIKVGDKVSEGDVILKVEDKEALKTKDEDKAESESKTENQKEAKAQPTKSSKASTSTSEKDVTVPDIGDAKDVDVIEVMVKVGDSVKKEDPLITLEGDKATMDIPSPFDGTIKACHIKVGDKASEGTSIVTMGVTGDAGDTEVTPEADTAPSAPSKQEEKKEQEKKVQEKKSEAPSSASGKVYASPSVRRLAREFGVDLSLVKGEGRKGRIRPEDVKQFVKNRLSGGATGFSLPESKSVDFSKYGEISHQDLNRIKRLTAKNLHASWLTVPHVTQFDEADITELESFRQKEKEAAVKQGYKLTPLAFIVKAVVSALKQFPTFNASLSPSGESLIIKHYYHMGIAVDTPEGLVVPVIRDADKKSIGDIAREMGVLSEKARNKALKPQDMSGGSFTISSLGGISGTAFTPIVNAPEVAILGVSRTKWQPVLKGNDFIPRLMLPLSLSYDHRVIDGAEGARFTLYLSKCLSDIRTLLL